MMEGKMTFWGQRDWSRTVATQKVGSDKDLLQPLKEDGTINKNFVQAYGTERLEKETKMSKQEIMSEVERYG